MININTILPDYSFLNPVEKELNLIVMVNDKMTLFIANMYLNSFLEKKILEEHDVVIIFFLRQIVAYQDTLTPLIKYGKSDGIEVVKRTILELMVQLLFIVKAEKEVKAKLYNYFNARSKENYLKSILVNKNDIKYLKSIGISFNKLTEDRVKIIEAEILELEKLFCDINYMESITDYTKNFNKFKSWYYLYDTKYTSLKQLFIEMEWEDIYNVFYNHLSKRTHGTNVSEKKFGFSGMSNIEFYDVRYPIEMSNTVYHYMSLANKFIEQFNIFTDPKKHKAHMAWYQSELLPLLKQLKNIKF